MSFFFLSSERYSPTCYYEKFQTYSSNFQTFKIESIFYWTSVYPPPRFYLYVTTIFALSQLCPPSHSTCRVTLNPWVIGVLRGRAKTLRESGTMTTTRTAIKQACDGLCLCSRTCWFPAAWLQPLSPAAVLRCEAVHKLQEKGPLAWAQKLCVFLMNTLHPPQGNDLSGQRHPLRTHLRWGSPPKTGWGTQLQISHHEMILQYMLTKIE